ncbi:hypothetical protein PLICRDRAFT_389798 [Plicaturopsis crispa FD-325 SS-3]|nr:hypothetical protein PLICRDRAFT_389798 [Plicaturopsis crispa FD-325 SS-3]
MRLGTSRHSAQASSPGQASPVQVFAIARIDLPLSRTSTENGSESTPLPTLDQGNVSLNGPSSAGHSSGTPTQSGRLGWSASLSAHWASGGAEDERPYLLPVVIIIHCTVVCRRLPREPVLKRCSRRADRAHGGLTTRRCGFGLWEGYMAGVSRCAGYSTRDRAFSLAAAMAL